MVLRNSGNGAFQVYDISNTAIVSSATLGTVGLNWQVAGFGDFNGDGTSDMVLRNSGTGAFQVYDINNNAIVSSVSLGTVGLNWQVAGFGNFSSNAGETDMILRNTSTGQFELYDIVNNQITSAFALGTDPPTDDASVGQLVQAMAGVGGGSGAADGLNAPFVNADTSQQTFLTTPHT